MFSVYAWGYALAVLWRSGAWLGRVRTVNVVVAWLWIGLAFATHSPLLDPLRLSLANQLSRLASGRGPPRARGT